MRSEIGRHMVTIIQNVTKDMEKVSCQVTNGYGVPMQATRKITINCECNGYMKIGKKFTVLFLICSCTENTAIGHHVSAVGRTCRIKMFGESKTAAKSNFLARS